MLVVFSFMNLRVKVKFPVRAKSLRNHSRDVMYSSTVLVVAITGELPFSAKHHSGGIVRGSAVCRKPPQTPTLSTTKSNGIVSDFR